MLLEPVEAALAAYSDLCLRIAERVGGVPNPMPHVTVAYLQAARPEVAPAMVVEAGRRLAQLVGLPATIRAQGWLSFRDVPHPLFGYTLNLRVVKSESLQAWQQAATQALTPEPLVTAIPWEQMRPHVQVLRHIPVPPQEAIAALERAPGIEPALTFRAGCVVLSQLENGEFTEWLRLPIPAHE